MLALYNELEEIIPLFLFSEFVKGQRYLCLECLAELTLETTRWLPDGPVAKDLPAGAGDGSTPGLGRFPRATEQPGRGTPPLSLSTRACAWQQEANAWSQRGALPAAPGESSEDPEQPHISEQTNIKTVPSVFPARGFLLTNQFLQGLKDYSGFLCFFQSIWCFTHFKIHVHVKIGETLPQTTKFLSLPKLCAIFVQYFSFLVVNPTN